MAENIPTRPRIRGTAVIGDAPAAPPDTLSQEAADLWRAYTTEWLIDPAGLPILQGALEHWDQYQTCRALVAAEGPTVSTGQGMIRQHPAAKLALDSFTQFRQAMRQLGLEPAD